MKLSVGYNWLKEKFGLKVLPHYRRSFVDNISGIRRETNRKTKVETVIYPQQYYPGDNPAAHLEFALKHEGVNLGYLRAAMNQIDPGDIEKQIKAKPTGQYARKIWFLYEQFVGKQLDLEDCAQGNYVNLLDPNNYYTTAGTRHKRYRIRDNSLGPVSFSPVVRKTEYLEEISKIDFRTRIKSTISSHDLELYNRSIRYLYGKETKASFDIERETPTQQRFTRFVRVLKHAGENDLTKERLRDIQNILVDDQYKAGSDYRKSQVYVGESGRAFEYIHYIAPRYDDLDELMAGWYECYDRMNGSDVPSVVQAAVLSFSFVFIHPYDDGNGRLHRYIIHDILARDEFTPDNIVVPVSAVMLNDPLGYDRTLEYVSDPLMQLIEFETDRRARVHVKNDTADFYRYIDYTPIAEYLAQVVETSIKDNIPKELSYLLKFDKLEKAVKDIVDLPGQGLSLLLRLITQNDGKLSMKKRKKFFSELSPSVLDEIEAAYSEIMGEGHDDCDTDSGL